MKIGILCITALLAGGLVQSSSGAVITSGHFDFSGTLYVTNFTTNAVVTPAGTCPASATGMACIFWTDPQGVPPTGQLDKVDISNSSLPNGDVPLALAGSVAGNISNLQTPPEVVGSIFLRRRS